MKGVLRIAGGLKRARPDRSEMEILMRALRDSNLPKFVSADFDIFLGLVSDLFPKIGTLEASPIEVDKEMAAAVKTVLKEEGKLQPEATFMDKCVNLYELFNIRHCVFILGAAGSAKSQVWRTLVSAMTHLGIRGGRSVSSCLNPKAVTSDDLYGYVHPVSKEPYDGIIAKIMREYWKSQSGGYKWVVLDGDIDAEWIESMNTVMDDNKVLTLVSNERIPSPTRCGCSSRSRTCATRAPPPSRAPASSTLTRPTSAAAVVDSWMKRMETEHKHRRRRPPSSVPPPRALGARGDPRQQVVMITPLIDFSW